MNARIIAGLLAVPIVLIAVMALGAKSLWKDRNVYSSGLNLKVGDVLMVRVEDVSQMRFSIAINNNSSFAIASNPDAGITSFLPKASANRKVNNNDKTEVSGGGKMAIIIAAQIAETQPNGMYKISGIKEYSFNGNRNTILVSGIIDPHLVRGRSISSGDIAGFRIEVRGSREGTPFEMKRDKIKEGQTAAGSAQLNEEEKQRIIIDYLQKIMRMLMQ